MHKSDLGNSAESSSYLRLSTSYITSKVATQVAITILSLGRALGRRNVDILVDECTRPHKDVLSVPALSTSNHYVLSISLASFEPPDTDKVTTVY